MNTRTTIIGKEHRRMRNAGIADATWGEALGYLLWRLYRREPWRLFRAFHWALRYADYHQEAVAVDDLANRRLSAECAERLWDEKRCKLSA